MTERVQVVVRIRPFIPSDPPDAGLNTIVLDDTHVSVGNNRVFKVDGVFMMEAESEEIYTETVAPLVARYIGGCNASVLAYGQTGTGKTFTVQTMLPLLLTQVLESSAIREGATSARDAADGPARPPLLRLQYVEVYGETVRDLLEDPSTRLDPSKPNRLRLATTTAASPTRRRSTSPPAGGSEAKPPSALLPPSPSSSVVHTSCAVLGATIVPVHTIKEAAEFIALGDARRATGATNVHEHSSRSHAILTLFHPRFACRLDVVDLAGSERGKKTGNTGIRFQESIGINTGLLALGNVIRALSRNHRAALTKEANIVAGGDQRHPRGDRLTPASPASRPDVGGSSQHIPYRSSKLTRLLQDTLGGSSATLFIACVAPDTYNRDETLRTLQYCSLALQVLNTPFRQYDRLQRAQSRGRRGHSRSAVNSPSSEPHEEGAHEPGIDGPSGHGESRAALVARIDELQASSALLQQQYDEQDEVLASICESYADAKERLELWERELRKDEGLFTQQIRVVQLLMQENQRLRHRLGKLKATAIARSEKHRGGQHRDASAGVLDAGDHRENVPAVKEAAELDALQSDATALLRNLLHRHNAMSAAATVQKHRGEGPLAAEAGVRAAATTAPPADDPPPVSALSPYRHLNFKSGTTLPDSFGVDGVPPLRTIATETATPGAASAAASEPVQSFIRSLLRQHGILTGKENADAARAAAPGGTTLPTPLHGISDGDEVLRQRTPQDAAWRTEASPLHDATVPVVTPPVPETALMQPVKAAVYPSAGGNAAATTPPSFYSRQRAQRVAEERETDVPRSAEGDVQLLQLASELLRYEETNTDLRNQVRLLQAKVDDKAREAARLRLEVQDMKDAYSSLSAMTE
ncbi:putative kinesin [Leptomonas pyrrhocoris]|uniref:Putative kinesin n=1 Tax=Leptomonas pyrrhocoris TaxID=157538 RepID=A0A0M9G6Y0_LEPPY|nr:putative kinesin [Leptomonas pyrrhocoris]KPA83723.1 putative kinesin [Leptomonas pyrrhocoris]|eukprot:XP_015662162.1 putative kinesin [Leptomonas pyrrhocoris]